MRVKVIAVAAVLVLVPAVAVAQNVGKCGWGSKLFEDNRGMAPQVLAVTTNGTFGNQTFGISSGTSGCTQDGLVQSNWQTVSYIDGNMNKLARDMSRGSGESLDTLATLLGVKDDHRPLFAELVQQNFSRIFASEDAASYEVVDALRATLRADRVLAEYAEHV